MDPTPLFAGLFPVPPKTPLHVVLTTNVLSTIHSSIHSFTYERLNVWHELFNHRSRMVGKKTKKSLLLCNLQIGVKKHIHVIIMKSGQDRKGKLLGR